jgi:hypothetical protein
MEIEYIAQEYASLFVRAEDKVQAANEIIARINNLKFEDGSLLDNDQKKYILQLIGEFISNKRIWKYKYGGYIISPKAYDNESYLNLIEYIFSQIKK